MNRPMMFTALVIVLAVLGSAPANAEVGPNDVGVWWSKASFEGARINDGESDFRIDFGGENGYAVSYARRWTHQFATELVIHRLSSDAEATLHTDAEDVTFDLGNVDLTVFSAAAQWHFRPSSRIDPYLGAGAAYVMGDVDISADPDDPEFGDGDTTFESEVSVLANAGVTVGMTPGVAVVFDAKYFPFNAADENDPLDRGIDIDPLVLSLGVKFRF